MTTFATALGLDTMGNIVKDVSSVHCVITTCVYTYKKKTVS